MYEIDNEPLISIIVPVYNVQKFLPECLNSIISQTYTNLEIIIVDDGSSDESGRICDIYSQKDKRVKVIHKKNGGLSDARNVGLEYAKGEFIGFVDSDDYIDENMIRELYRLCKEKRVFIASARWGYIGDKKRFEGIPVPNNKVEVLTANEYFKSILISGYENKRFATFAVWNRLYHKSVLKSLTFPVGKCYEDIIYSYNAIRRAKKIVYINKDFYNYRIRKGSITNHRDKNDKFINDFIYSKLQEEKHLDALLQKDGLHALADIVRMRSAIDLYYITRFIQNDLLEDAKRTFTDFHTISLRNFLRLKLPIRLKLSYVWNRYFSNCLKQY